jgi:hypothetical protein
MLHPDKLVAIHDLFNKQPKRTTPKVKKSYSVGSKAGPAPGSELIQNLAFRLREASVQRHFDKVRNGGA